jgi:hypothetical protein
MSVGSPAFPNRENLFPLAHSFTAAFAPHLESSSSKLSQISKFSILLETQGLDFGLAVAAVQVRECPFVERHREVSTL